MNKMLKPSIFLMMFLLFGISAAPAKAAGIFKCVAKDGQTYFKDKPCPVDNKETELQAVKDPTNGYIAPEFVPDADAVQKSGVVIGNDSSDENEGDPEVDEDDKVSLSKGNNQSGGKNSAGENSANQESNVAAQRTESDKIFNSELKKNLTSSNKSSVMKPARVTTLEPLGTPE